MKINTKNIALLAALILLADQGLTGCSAQASAATPAPTAAVTATPTSSPAATPEPRPEVGGHYTDGSDGGHAILAEGEKAAYSNITVIKTGGAEGDEADFYGANAAVLATDGAELTLRSASVTSDGKHANAVFSYGEGTVVNIADSTITTTGDCSGGVMTTGGGTMNADNLVVRTSGRSSAAIRSDRGGGTVRVSGGTYSTDGVGSPAIYSTADIAVSGAELSSSASQGVVVEGKNAVRLENVTLTANNTRKNSDKSPWYQAVMIYQSMSGDADEGTALFAMRGGSLTNLNGDVFFVNNTDAVIELSETDIVNDDPEGVFLRAAAAGWGREGMNGGHVKLYASAQTIDGDMAVDRLSTLNLYLGEGSVFTGAVSLEEGGGVYVELTDGAVWSLTGDSEISSLSCGADSVRLNGHTLTVDGEVYTEGTASEGGPIGHASFSVQAVPQRERPPEKK